jgi:RNA polymerase-binding transcription factor DksA
MNENQPHEYNNEEEAEVAQLNTINNSLNAIAKVQQQLALQAAQPSLTECDDCGEDIPVERQLAIKGCTRCIYCQEISERKARNG